MRYKEFWIALGIGALAGGVTALLLAPQTGAKTRKQLKRGVEDAGESLEEAAEYLKRQAERLGKEAQKFIERGKDQFDDAASGAMKSATKALKAAQNLV